MAAIQRMYASTRHQVRQLRTPTFRRHAHDAHHDSHHSTGPATGESFGRGFYISLALVPTLLALYKFTAPDSNSERQPYLTRLIGSLDAWRADLADRNDLHTRTIEQAARDRNLFINSPDVRRVPLRFPEGLNSGSPFNVPAGQGRGNYEAALQKYEKESFEANERRHVALRENRIACEQPRELGHRLTPS